jgi:hypothetical protein
MKSIVGEVEDLDKVWDTLDMCLDCSEKYIVETLEPIGQDVQFV